MTSQTHSTRLLYRPRPYSANIPRPAPRPLSRWLTEPMPLEVARNVIGAAEFDQAVEAGPAFCLSRYMRAWLVFDIEKKFAWEHAHTQAVAHASAGGVSQ